MTRIIKFFARNSSSLTKNSPWGHLKGKLYTPDQENQSFVIRDGDVEIKYTRENKNTISKTFLHRFIDAPTEYLTYPGSKEDREAFDYFIQMSKNNGTTRSDKNHPFKQVSRSFATLSYNDQQVKAKLSIIPELSVSTSDGDKIVSGLSFHRGALQVNAFKDIDALLSRVQSSEHNGVSTPFLRLGDKALLTNTDLEMQYDLYCIEKDLYNKVVIRTSSKLSNHVQATSHFTGMLKTDKDGNVIFEYSDDNKERPKTEYNPQKGKFVSMESHQGNTASLTHIAYKTQGPLNKYELVFIPKNHPHIKQIINICEALLNVKNVSTQTVEELDVVLKKHGVSNSEIAVELFNEITKHSQSSGIFYVNIEDFCEQNPEIVKFILDSDLLDNNLSYNLEVVKKKDSYDEPYIVATDSAYEDPDDFVVVGDSTNMDEFAK